MGMIRAKKVRDFELKGTIDGHIPIGVTYRITGGDETFRLTIITVNWGRGYKPGEFRRNVLNVLEYVEEKEYVVLLIQELDEDDSAREHYIFKKEMMPGTTLVGWATHEPIAVSPGVKVRRQRKRKLMGSGLEIGAPAGTGPVRWLTSCVIEIHGVLIGLGNQHPHRNLKHPKVQKARAAGERVTRVVIGELAAICDIVFHGGDMNDLNYPKSHPKEKVAHKRGLDTIRIIVTGRRRK